MNRRNPYRLFDYYSEADADLFFGREREVSAVVGDILANKLLVLFARSGSGKTSLLKAGIGPALHQLGEDEASRIRLVTIRLVGDATPEQSALKALKTALGEQGPRPGESLHEVLRRLCSFPNDGALGKQPMGLVLAFDQFEELFITLFRDQPGIRAEFAKQLAGIIYDDSLRAYVVLSLRADHFHHLNEFRQVIPSIFQNNTNLELRPFDDEAALRVIRGPTQLPGSTFTWEAGLPERIVADLKRLNEDQDGVLPIHLQIVCYGLVERLEPGETVITARLYSAQAGHSASGESPATAMIRRRILEPIEAVTGRDRRRNLCRVLRALTTHHRTKQPRSFSGLSRLVSPARLKPILDRLESNLLVRRETAAAEIWYELRHDYVAREIAPWLDGQEQALKASDRRQRIAAMALLAVVVTIAVDLYVAWNSYTARLGVPGRPDELVLVRHPAFGRFEPAWWRREIATGFAREQLLASGVTNHSFALHDAVADWNEIESQLMPEARWLLQFATKVKGAAVSTNANDATLFSALQHSDADLYAMADERIFDLVIVAARSGNPKVRSDALRTLGRLGPDLSEAQSSLVANTLMEAINDRDADIRSSAARSLGEFGPQLGTERVRAIVDKLLALVRDQDWDIGVHPARVLEKWTEIVPIDRIEPVVAGLVDRLRNPDARRRQWAADELSRVAAKIGPDSGGTLITALLATLEDQDPEVRRLALQQLNQVRSGILAEHVNEVIDASVVSLADNDPRLRELAVAVLRRLQPIPPGPDAAAACALTTAALNDPEPEVRFAATAALGAFPDPLMSTETAGRLAESLKVGLRHWDSEVQNWSASAFGDFAAKVPADSLGSCLDALIEMLKDRDSSVRGVDAALALERIAPRLPAEQFESVVSALVAALDLHPEVLEAIGVALGNRWDRLPPQHLPSAVNAVKALAARSTVDQLAFPIPLQLAADHRAAIVDAVMAALPEFESPSKWEVAGRALTNCLAQLPPAEFKPAFEAILARLADPESVGKGSVLVAIGALVPRLSNDLSGRAVNALVTSLQAINEDTRWAAASALRACGSTLPADLVDAVVHALLAALKDDRSSAVADALAMIESKFRTRPVPSILLELDRAGVGHHAAFRALAKAKWQQDETTLLAALENDDSRWRVFALHVLARRESLTETTLNRLRLLRNDTRPWVRLAAFRCLVEIEQEKQVQAFERKEVSNSTQAGGSAKAAAYR